MFEAIVPAEPLQRWVDSIHCLVDECRIHISEDGFRTAAVEPSNVMMVYADLEATQFQSFEVGSGVIAINLGRLDDALGVADADDLVHLSMDREKWRLEVTVNQYQFAISCIDPESVRSEPDQPDLDEHLSAEFVVEGREYLGAIKAVDLVTDHIWFSADPDAREVVVYGRGDSDDVDVTWGGDELVRAHVPEAEKSLFSIDFLKETRGPIPKTAEVSFKLGEDSPIIWSYEPDDGIAIEYMLAPRIKSE